MLKELRKPKITNISLMRYLVFFVLFGLGSGCVYPQSPQNDQVKIDYRKVYSYCLDGDVKSALELLEKSSSEQISPKESAFKIQFEKRFKFAGDESDFLESRQSPIIELLQIYRDYWRASLLDNSKKYDAYLINKLMKFLNEKYPSANIADEKSLDTYLVKYVESFNLHTTGFAKTGKFYDLLVWGTNENKEYSFELQDEEIKTEVILMDKFLTLGWEEYATLGRAYPGGWATKKALYCVKKAYDLNSENFLISYLAHEGRHFADYKIFPKLSGTDLEYRAKLTELSLAKTTLFDIISTFIANSNYQSENPHSAANHLVIRDLSKKLFQSDFEKNIDKWKAISAEKINSIAYQLLRENSKALNSVGKKVEKFIK